MYSVVLLILLVTVVLVVSGCSGSNTSGTPTPTPQPGGYVTGTPTLAATQGPTATPGAGTAMVLGDLYSKEKFSWIEYKMTSSYAGQSMTNTMKMEMLGQEMHEGKMIDHIRITTSFGSQDVWSDPDAPADTNTTDFASSKAVLTRVGPDTVTINGKTYACTKYTATMTDDNVTTRYTFWHSPDAPAPVQYESVSEGGTSTTQLTGWG